MFENSENFKKQHEFGKLGELVAKKYYTSQNYEVLDTSEDENYFCADTDLIITSPDGTKESVEVKTDSHDEWNFFAEIESDTRYHSDGWVKKSLAQTVFYYFHTAQIAYIFQLEDFRRYITTHKLTTKYVKDGKSNKYGMGKLVPIYDFMKETKNVQRIDFGRNFS